MTLYDIADDLLRIQRALEELEETDDHPLMRAAIQEYLTGSKADIEQKVDGYCGLIRNLEAMADARAAEARRMQELARADAAKAERLKATLLWFLREVACISKLDTARFRVTVAANGGKPPLVVPEDPAAWPQQFVRERVVKELDREALRDALERGEIIDGCGLAERGHHLRIR